MIYDMQPLKYRAIDKKVEKAVIKTLQLATREKFNSNIITIVIVIICRCPKKKNESISLLFIAGF
jgi:hypothetical protein